MFVRGSYIPNLGLLDEANRFTFENKIGEISDPIESKLFFYVVQVKDRKPAGIPPFSDAEPFIRKNLIHQKQYELAYEKGMKIYNEVLKGKSFKKVAGKYGEEVKDSGEFNRNSYIPGVGKQPEFIGTAFALDKENRLSPPIELRNGTYILQLISKSEVNDSYFQAKGDSLSLDLLRKKQVDFYTLWFENLKKNAKIKDLRNQYFRETF